MLKRVESVDLEREYDHKTKRMKLKKNSRKQMTKLERIHCVTTLYCEGKSQKEISEVLEVSLPTIASDLASVRKEWLERSLLNYNDRKAEELAKIDRLEAEAWEAWYRSCHELQIERKSTDSVRFVPPVGKGSKKKGKLPKGKGKPSHQMIPIRTRVETTIKGQTGDPRFLEQIAWCIETRLKVMGALKPDTTNIAVTQINWGEMVATPASQDTIEQVLEQVEHEVYVQENPTGANINPLLLTKKDEKPTKNSNENTKNGNENAEKQGQRELLKPRKRPISD